MRYIKQLNEQALRLFSADLNHHHPGPPHPHRITPQYYLTELAAASEVEVVVSRDDFLSAMEDLVPSVSMEEMHHYQQVQTRFANMTLNK